MSILIISLRVWVILKCPILGVGVGYRIPLSVILDDCFIIDLLLIGRSVYYLI